MEILRQNAGIDIAKDSFVVTLTLLLDGQVIKHEKTKLFKNKPEGFEEFYKWICGLKDEKIPVDYTMEATGVYYESLAYFLHEKQAMIHVLLPNKAKKFAESLNIKSKTDKIDSKTLGQMGVERILQQWKPSSKIYRKLRTLTREKQQLVKERTRCKNHLHAEEHSAEPLRTTLTRMKNHIKYLNKQIEAVEKDIKALIEKDELVANKVKKITTIPGIALSTVATVVAETGGFDSFSSLKQLTSYAGYDVCIKESGAWKGKTRISKKGNSHIRRALYMPSISTIKYSDTYKTFYNRLNEKNQSGLIAGTAVQRKLLGLIYTLWKSDSEYIENYHLSKVKAK